MRNRRTDDERNVRPEDRRQEHRRAAGGGEGDYGLGLGASDRRGGYLDSIGGVRYAPPHAGTHYGRGPRRQLRSDERLFEDVAEALTDDIEVDASDIEVHVRDSDVYLEGTVADRRQKRVAEDVAQMVFGVRDVFNRLRVRSRDDRRE